MFLVALLPAASESLELEDFRPSLAVDMGQVVHGKLLTSDLELIPVNRSLIALEYETGIGDRWSAEAGMMGILWWPFSSTGLAPHERTVRVEPRLSIARLTHHLSNDPTGSRIELGYFPYKYNPDAQNLGEYLYRSGTYPGLVRTTDGFRLIDHAAYDAYGASLLLSTFGGILIHSVNLFSEPAVVPVGDLTPAYEASLEAGIFTAGLGAAWNRLISFDEEQVTPKALDNAYIQVRPNDRGLAPYEGPYSGAPSNIRSLARNKDTSVAVLHRWTHRGVKLMSRAALDLGFMLPESLRGPKDLRIFTEVAILGWENQPYFYTDRSKRMPVMAGLNLPTFKLLDILSLQVEHYSNPFDNIKNFTETSWPIWTVNHADTASHGLKRDDWKWSFYARRTVGKILKIHFQAANDHLRLPIFDYSSTETTLTQNPKHWYYVLRMECGI